MNASDRLYGLPRALIEAFQDKWQRCESLKESRLIRLSILRDLNRTIHAEKSGFLARSEKSQAEELSRVQRKVESLIHCDLSQVQFQFALEDTPLQPSLPEMRRNLPDSFFETINPSKLTRYDRKWELELVSEAIAIGWNVWVLDNWVEIKEAEAFHKALADQLYLSGVNLYVEGAPSSTSPTPKNDTPIWQGNWFILLEPSIRTPGSKFNVTELPGASSSPSAPKWQFLYPVKENEPS